jgi:hypothetical protein
MKELPNHVPVHAVAFVALDNPFGFVAQRGSRNLAEVARIEGAARRSLRQTGDGLAAVGQIETFHQRTEIGLRKRDENSLFVVEQLPDFALHVAIGEIGFVSCAARILDRPS